MTNNLLFVETKGFSMWPFLKGSEKLIIRKVPINNVRLGDLVLYRSNNQLVCHRLVKKVQTNWGLLIYSKGDACFGKAEAVNERMFLGKAVGIIKDNKIKSLEGTRQRIFKKFSLVYFPLFNLMLRFYYRTLRRK